MGSSENGHGEEEAGAGIGGTEHHVPQHSRRVKLRFPPHDSPPAASSLLLQDSSSGLLFPNTAASSLFFSYLSPNPCSSHDLPFFGGGASVSLPSSQFSLSLSSSAAAAAAHPRPRPSRMADQGGPLRPFTGYAEVLSGSRFLEPARQLLEEFCDVGRAVAGGGLSGEELGLDREAEEVLCGGRIEDGEMMMGEEQQWKKNRLDSMLDEVYRRYKHYCQQVQSVVRAFESVPGLSNAAPFVSMALQTMSKQFSCVKSMISSELQQANKTSRDQGNNSTQEAPGFGLINGSFCGPRVASKLGSFKQQSVWRPQRGLPEQAVAVLRKWLYEHFLHPYPTDADKQMLAKQTGLSRNQVSNWFINARVRLWKPMVEEIHSLELKQSHKVISADKKVSTNKQSPPPPVITVTNSWKNQCATSKPVGLEDSQIPSHNEEPISFSSNDLSTYNGVGVGLAAGEGSGVSLTLGLHQSSGVGFTEPLLGLDYNDGYVMSTPMDVQDRDFGRVVGGHLIHDYVG